MRRRQCPAARRQHRRLTANSNHSGGVNVTMADGSVKFIKNSINYITWWGLGTRNGGEIISSDAY